MRISNELSSSPITPRRIASLVEEAASLESKIAEKKADVQPDLAETLEKTQTVISEMTNVMQSLLSEKNEIELEDDVGNLKAIVAEIPEELRSASGVKMMVEVMNMFAKNCTLNYNAGNKTQVIRASSENMKGAYMAPVNKRGVATPEGVNKTCGYEDDFAPKEEVDNICWET